MAQKSLHRFRKIAFLEGLSFLALLFIAMPVKYMLGEPALVRYVGMLHGVLFILFILLLVDAARLHRWSMKFNTAAFIASLIPFGTFWLEKRLKAIAA